MYGQIGQDRVFPWWGCVQTVIASVGKISKSDGIIGTFEQLEKLMKLKLDDGKSLKKLSSTSIEPSWTKGRKLKSFTSVVKSNILTSFYKN